MRCTPFSTFKGCSPYYSHFSTGTGLLIYLICRVVIPVANKTEDRLKMRSEEVNLENLTEEMIKEPENITQEEKVKPEQYGCLNFLFRVVAILMRWTLVCLF